VLVWYDRYMSGTFAVVMGDRGRLVVPAELRARANLSEGTPLVLVETPDGVVLLTRDQMRDRVRAGLAGSSLVADLLENRRREAAAEE
jgi:AbrB family looped-hinge helix DNA binding protein